MSATYNGISFDVYTEDDQGRTARFQNAARYSEQEVPYANFAFVQYGGRGNPRVTLKLNLTNDSDYASLNASADGVARTLTNPFGDGVDYANVVLFDVSGPMRQNYAADWNFQVTFVQKGA